MTISKKGEMTRVLVCLWCAMLSVIIPQIPNSYAKQDKYGGTLIWGVAYQPTLINPLFTTQSVSASLELLIFNSLVRLNAKGDIEPDLAEKWEVSSDGLTYTFYLRKGVRFHDGIECTAEDVKFTYDKLTDKKIDSPFCSFFKIAREFKVLDKYTFQISLDKPSSSFIYRLVREIIPKHLLENTDLKNTSFNFHPVGTGPFKFKEWGKDDQITLEYNPDYYEGRPYLDKIIVKVYPDAQSLWTALMRQEVDLSLFIDRENYEIVRSDPTFKTYAYPIDLYYAIVYNLEDMILSDKRIREAIAYGIDRKSLIQDAAFGYGKECNGPFYPDSIGFNPAVAPLDFNPDKALELLHEAGWQDTNSDGILEKEGKDLEIRMLVDERNDIYQRIAMLLRQYLQRIGIKLVVQLYNDDKVLTEDFLKQNKSQAQLKSLLSGVDAAEKVEEWSPEWIEGTHSLWKYRNDEVQRYFTLGKTAQDKKKRRWIYQEIHRFIYQDQPACFLYFPFYFHAVSSQFENIDEFFTLAMPVQTISKWFANQK